MLVCMTPSRRIFAMFRGKGALTHSNIPIQHRGKQIVSLHEWPKVQDNEA